MKKYVIIAIFIISISRILFADVENNSINNYNSCGYLAGHWHGNGYLTKSSDCKYEVSAHISSNNSNVMLLKMRNTSSRSLCKQYYSEEVVVNCNNYNLSISNQKITMTGYLGYDYNSVQLNGTLLSRLHYHPFELSLYKD